MDDNFFKSLKRPMQRFPPPFKEVGNLGQRKNLVPYRDAQISR
jgi:hypothetical protein